MIELLVVVGILAVLVVAALFFLNPSQLASQGRDSNRVSDLTTLNQDVSLYHETIPAGNLGTSSVLYISIPDLTATTTAGTNCASMGLPPAPNGDTYHCAASSTYRSNSGTGWIPVNFGALTGIPLATLPIDPVNTTSSNEYYVYVTNGRQYEFIANPEAKKDSGNATSSFEQGNEPPLSISFPGETITYTTSTPATPYSNSLAFDSHTNAIWAAFGGFMTVLDDTTYATSTFYWSVANHGGGLVFDPHTNTIWAIAHDVNAVVKFNDTTYASSSYTVGSSPSAIAFDSNTNTIWVANSVDGTVTKINDTSFVASTYSVGGSPEAITFDPHTNTIWTLIGNGVNNSLVKIDDATFATSSYAVGSAAGKIAFDSHNNSLWLADFTNNALFKIDDTTFVTSSYAVGTLNVGAPSILFDPHTNTIWEGSSLTSNYSQFGEDGSIIGTYDLVSGTTQGAVFDSHNNGVWVTNGTITQFIPSR